MKRESLGEFEQLVLLAALRLGEQAYAVSILEEIDAHTGRRPSHGAVFVALRRLEKKGLICQQLGEPTERRAGRPPRMVTVQPEALEKLRESRTALLSMWKGLDQVSGTGA